MSQPEDSTLPTAAEGLGNYVQRLRGQLGLTQKELSEKAGIHIQTIRKIEGGRTSRLNQKVKDGLTAALAIPAEYLDAAVKKVVPEAVTTLKFCPKCWTPGTTVTSSIKWRFKTGYA